MAGINGYGNFNNFNKMRLGGLNNTNKGGKAEEAKQEEQKKEVRLQGEAEQQFGKVLKPGDMKSLLINKGIKIDQPKMELLDSHHYDSLANFERTMGKGLYKPGDIVSFYENGIYYSGTVEQDGSLCCETQAGGCYGWGRV